MFYRIMNDVRTRTVVCCYVEELELFCAPEDG